MTAEELDRLESLWKQGVKRSDIADELGYCEETLRYWMRKDPIRFPLRHRHVKDESKMELWCYRIIAGRATIEEVARLFGIRDEAVRIRVRRIERKEASERMGSCRSRTG